jgi:hypothetical protein
VVAGLGFVAVTGLIAIKKGLQERVMERTILILLASWLAFDALIAGLLLRRRSQSQHYRWVIDARAPTRPRQLAPTLIVAHRRRY